MLSKRCQRQHSFFPPSKLPERLKQSTSDTLSSDTVTTTTTTSSGYSTGGSSVSTMIVPSSKKSTCHQHKSKSKGFHNFINKLKTFIIAPKTKLTTSKETSSTNMALEYSTSYPLSSSTNNTISLPFTYFNNNNNNNSSKQSESNNTQTNDSYGTSATTFEKISAWLDHTEIIRHDGSNLLFIDDVLQESIPSSPVQVDQHEIMMKKTSSATGRTPKRSTSMVSTMIRPVIEQRNYEKPVSPTCSFSSSILARGMTERLTPQTNHYQSRTNLTEEETNILVPKSNRRRVIDFSRRRTVGGPTDQATNNKENLSINPNQQIYRFSPTTSTNIVTKKYYFHPTSSVKNDDILMNSYGLTILQPHRQSVSAHVKKPQISQTSSLYTPRKSLNHRPSFHLLAQEPISESLDDILCDREVESYFYPKRQQSSLANPQHMYMNLGSSSNYCQPPYVHSTLC